MCIYWIAELYFIDLSFCCAKSADFSVHYDISIFPIKNKPCLIPDKKYMKIKNKKPKQPTSLFS